MKKNIFILLLLSTVVFANFTRDNTTGIVTDNSTALQWQDNVEASTTLKDWTSAINYCETLILGSYNDWRLPNINELQSLVDDRYINPSVEKSIFQNVAANLYWSSTTYVNDFSVVWGISFKYGYEYVNAKSSSSYIRCVR